MAMLREDSANELQNLGLLDKEHLDALYSHVSSDEAVDAETQKAAVADEITSAIQSDPNVAEIAARVNAALNPTATPTPAPVDASMNAPLPAPVAPPVGNVAALPPTPTPAPMVPPSPLPMPDAPQAGASGTWEPNPNAPVVPNDVPAQAPPAPPTAMDKAIAGDKAGALNDVALAAESKRAEATQSAQALHSDAQILGKVADNAKAQVQQAQSLEALQAEVLAKQNQALEKYNTLQIDPDRFWNTRSTPEKIAAYIGIILSGIGGGSKGVDAIDKAIKDDIESQKASFELQAKGIEMRHSLLSDISSTISNKQQAEALAQAAAYNQAKLQIDRAANATQNVQAQANLLNARAELEAKQMEAQQRASWYGMNDATSGAVGPQTTKVTGNTIPVMLDSMPQSAIPKEEQKNFIPGLGIASDDQTADRIRKIREVFPVMISQLNELKKLRTDVGVESSNSRDRAKAQTIWFSLLNKVRGMEALGALDDGTVAVFSAAIPQDPLGAKGLDITGISERIGNKLGDPLIAKIDELKDSLSGTYRSKIKTGLSRITESGIKELESGIGVESDMKKASGKSK